MSWSTVEECLEVLRQGKAVLVMDSADREDECDLVWAAETCTPELMAFCIRHTTGIICIAAEKARLLQLGLHPATNVNTDPNGTNFYVSTDFLHGTTTGVSAADRAATARAFCDESLPAEAFSKPGHLFPLCANPMGVLARPGHTESTYDLCKLSGLKPIGCLGELMKDDGTMYRREASLEFARTHNIPIITVEQICEYRKKQEVSVAHDAAVVRVETSEPGQITTTTTTPWAKSTVGTHGAAVSGLGASSIVSRL